MYCRKLLTLALALVGACAGLLLMMAPAYAEGEQAIRIWMDGTKLMKGDAEWTPDPPAPQSGAYLLGAGNYYLDSDIVLGDPIDISRDGQGDVNVTLDLKGHKIALNVQEGEKKPVVMIANASLTLNDTTGGGQITGGTQSGIRIGDGGNLTMNGGAITENTGSCGGGVCCDANQQPCSFTMKGGTITKNTCEDEFGGGGVYCWNGSFTMYDGSIVNNEATNEYGQGGGIFVGQDCEVLIAGGNIAGNKAWSGGGVFALSSGPGFTMTGGEITGNSATGSGGGALIEYGANSPVQFKVSGSPKVHGNSVGEGGSSPDIYITTTIKSIKVIDSLGADAVLYVDAGLPKDSGTVAEGEDYVLKPEDASRFFSSKDSALVGALNDDGSAVIFKEPITSAEVTVTPSSATYDGTDKTPSVTVKTGETTLENDTDYTITYLRDDEEAKTVKDAGTYVVQVTGKGNYTGTKQATFVVDPKPVTVSGITSPGKPYDGDTTAMLNTTNAKIDGVVAGDDLVIASAVGAYADANAGAGKIVSIDSMTLSGASATNYMLAKTGQQTSTKADIARRPITLKAKEQTVELGGVISSTPTDVAIVAGSLVAGHAVTSVTLTADTKSVTSSEPIKLSATTIQDENRADVTANYDIATQDGVLTVSKAVAQVTLTPKAKEGLVYSGSAQALVTEGTATGGTMYYAVGRDATTAPDQKLFGTTVPAGTDAGSYYVWYKVVGDENHLDSEAACVTVAITKNTDPKPDPKPDPTEVSYTVTKGAGFTWTKGDEVGLSITFKRSDEGEADATFDHFVSASVDGKELTRDTDYSAEKGSVVVTLAPSYLNTLAVGTHELTAKFDDGTATTKFTVADSTDDSEADTIIIEFDANGGTGTMEPIVIKKGATVKLSKNVFKRSGYSFVGWNLEPDGSGQAYTDEQSIIASFDGTLYAQWRQASNPASPSRTTSPSNTTSSQTTTTSPVTTRESTTLAKTGDPSTFAAAAAMAGVGAMAVLAGGRKRR